MVVGSSVARTPTPTATYTTTRLLLQEKQHERALYASELQRALQHPALQPKFVPMYEKELQARHRQP